MPDAFRGRIFQLLQGTEEFPLMPVSGAEDHFNWRFSGRSVR
jgi:hypothetical protein